ncbi:lamin tail domain-containing protein [Chondromyces apiculatus]|uniref:LTD domain-containing protein n=1 Tax=Chondromyces apiculatus DSM 436 TaxID=1192034 RepID=A0A017TIC8_9BACT|nr:lamin tail domain-containing protein [Chondromyces apiculatus]EYF08637.1 Hypothetical protein CAP_2497 [Chondromyces apiculatus DSM 436]
MQPKLNLAFALSLALPAALLATSAVSCSVYDDGLVGPGGGTSQGGAPGNTGGAGGTGGSGGSGGEGATSGTGGSGGAGGVGAAGGAGGAGGSGGAPQCTVPTECPGADTECATRTCVGGTCGVDATPQGTALQQQTAGDCLTAQCDGQGSVMQVPSDADLPDDTNECTADACAQGAPTHTPLTDAPCTQGGSYCNALGACVACTLGSHCPSGVCSAQFTCSAPACNDTVLNGMETDVDCGGPTCDDCATGQLCTDNGDCIGGLCATTCQPTCSDTLKNNAETDVDCGGPTCAPCAIGQLCTAATDCASSACGADGLCQPRVLISEARARGLGGANDDFVELYNPMSVPVVLDNTWKLEARGSTAGSYTTRWTGSGVTLPPHGHYLIGGSTYTQMPTRDAPLSSGLADASSVRVLHATQVLDALCFYTTPSTLTDFQTGANFSCEGTPFHNTAGTNNLDRSMERLPGGAAGNSTDTGNNATDFVQSEPSNPQNLASPPTP